MDPDTLAKTGALGTALIPVLTPVAHGPLSIAQPLPQNPAEILASLMDFPGSVALAELLETAPTALHNPKGAESAGERLLLDAQARLDALEPLTLKPLVGRRAPDLPSLALLREALQRHGVVDDRSEAAAMRLADELGEPLRAAFGLSLRQAQAHVGTLRWEITHDLRALGPRADHLERLDATLTRSMQGKLGELLDRMEHAAHLTFVRACTHAVAKLPDTLDDDSLRDWCSQHGWLERYRERCVRMTKALFGHLRRGLEGLMRAAMEAEDP